MATLAVVGFFVYYENIDFFLFLATLTLDSCLLPVETYCKYDFQYYQTEITHLAM